MANSSLLATSECLKRLRRAVPIILSNQATHRSFDDPNYIYWHPFLILKGKIGFCSLSGADGVTDEFIDETLFKFDALFREFDICASIMRSVDMQTDEAIEAFRVSSKKFGEMWRTALRLSLRDRGLHQSCTSSRPTPTLNFFVWGSWDYSRRTPSSACTTSTW